MLAEGGATAVPALCAPPPVLAGSALRTCGALALHVRAATRFSTVIKNWAHLASSKDFESRFFGVFARGFSISVSRAGVPPPFQRFHLGHQLQLQKTTYHHSYLYFHSNSAILGSAIGVIDVVAADDAGG